MAIESLPAELLRFVVEQESLTPEDLCSLALSSPSLRDEAQRMLFKDPGPLIIGNERFSDDKFLNSIITSPKRLAPMVRTYSQVIDWERFRNTARKTTTKIPQKEREARQKLILGKIRRALQLMVNLKHLRHEELSRSNRLVERITSVLTEKCSFRLTSFAWTYVAVDGIQEELELFHHFLPRQPALRSLCFNRIQVPEGLPVPGDDFYTAARSVCPLLEDFSAPLDFILSVLPMRPTIKRLSWPTCHNDANRDKGDISSTNLACLSKSLESLEILDYHCSRWNSHSTSELLLISSHLKSLVFLSLDNLSALTPTILSKLPRLRAVAVTCYRSSVDLQEVKSALVQSPSLSYIVVYSVWGNRESYQLSWYLRYSLNSENELTRNDLPIDKHFHWDNMRSFRIP
ncbi:hypothetical protein D9619_012954 [Psilocybe cf. subviscida]|uniref:Uncharacterized protein n=1 Tax=Psilocybe cf. subviscida TaxID=2480587 RepID=A0A8H5BJN5_9AGAR|nr:hypothetical protein D9619_012954 [Psilocybe cf. subviscida]